MGVVIKCAKNYHGKNRKLFVYWTTAQFEPSALGKTMQYAHSLPDDAMIDLNLRN